MNDDHDFDEMVRKYQLMRYNETQAFDAACEEMYYHENGEVDPNGYIIERVEIIDGNLLWIHHDTRGI